MPEMRKVALVTGGAVRIGRAVTRALAAAGYDVAIHMRSERAECLEARDEVEAAGQRAALIYGELSIRPMSPAWCRRPWPRWGRSGCW